MTGGIREALEKLEYGAYVATAKVGDDRSGILVNLVSQVSYDPPLVILGVRKGRPLEAIISESGAFALNILSRGQMDLVRRFMERANPGQDRFEGLAVETRITGSPILRDVLAFVDCRVLTTFAPGDHTLFVGEVVDGDVFDSGQPLGMAEVNMHYSGR